MQRSLILAVALFRGCAAFEPSSVFDDSWLQGLALDDASSYTNYASAVHNFLESGEDSDGTDQYVGFAPLLLRAHPTASGQARGNAAARRPMLSDAS